MKYIATILICLLTTSPLLALDVDVDRLMEGKVSRNIPAAFRRATTEKKPILWVIYDASVKDMAGGTLSHNQYCVQGFFGLEGTKKLAAEKTVQVVATVKQKEAAKYWADDRPTKSPIIVITDSEGNLLKIFETPINPTDAYNKLKAELSPQ